MAPWSSRLLTPNPRNEASSSATATTSLSRTRESGRVTEADLYQHVFDIPSLSTVSPQPSSSKPTRQGSHGRSMSHPFPSLFTGRKKRQGDETAALTNLEFTDDDLLPTDSTIKMQPNTGMTTTRAPVDMVNGKCMVCDSSVRWPKNLKLFRCTVCYTINDLEPITPETRRSRDGQTGHTESRATTSTCSPKGTFWRDQEKTMPSIPPLSVEKTRQIVDSCIRQYLLDKLGHDEEEASSSTPSPRQSPAHGDSEGNAEPEPDTVDVIFTGNPSSVGPPKSAAIHLPKRPIDQGLRSEHPRYSQSMPSPSGDFGGRRLEPERRRVATKSPSEQFPTDQQRKSSSSNNQNLPGEDGRQKNITRNLFRPLENYIITSFQSHDCINKSFSTLRQGHPTRAASVGGKRAPIQRGRVSQDEKRESISELDAKTLLLGDFAENGSWWTGNRTGRTSDRPRISRSSTNTYSGFDLTDYKSPQIDFAQLNEWYFLVLNSGRSWQRILDELIGHELERPSDHELKDIEDQIIKAQVATQRVLLKVTEALLKRPGRPLQDPDNIRFLLIILANPLLYPSFFNPRNDWSVSQSRSEHMIPQVRTYVPSGSKIPGERTVSPSRNSPAKSTAGQHSGIVKRVLGLLACLPNECHHYLVSWFSRYSDGQFQRTVDLVGSFVTYRLTKQHGKPREVAQDPTAGLIPSISDRGNPTSVAALHAALGPVPGAPRSSAKKSEPKSKKVIYNDDWQIKVAARVMALLFSANNSGPVRRGDLQAINSPELGMAMRGKAHGQILATSHFYNTLLDYSDLVVDFEAWEGRRTKFAFCQYPFFLSLGAKIKIMEHDAHRQMEVKAREAFFDSIMTRKAISQYLVLKVRRDCLVEDSLKGVSEVVGSSGDEIKKGLRIEFKGEEGVDAGGLRKEWFLLLVRDVFNPEHGMFTYDEDSKFCYFNPNSFETSDQFFLVGVVLGLAIYNSTILDIALPPFAFRKLLAAGPAAAPGATSHAKPSMTYSLEDLAEYRPSLANGLKQLLEFDGDVESTFCRDFVADVDKYGHIVQIPLCHNGEKKPVTNANRREFVDLYVRYLLDTAVTRQFEPFKRGFFTVCGGNALSLFRPEEIELLIRGSDEALDIASLRAVSIYNDWGSGNPQDTEPVLQWFWDSFQNASPRDQRKLLSFITGSSCIPAMGATSLIIKFSCLGNDSPRFPVARTCFNMLSLYRYSSREKLETMLWRAVNESEGFGLK